MALEFFGLFSTILDFLFYDSYKFEPIVESFSRDGNSAFIKMIVSVLLESPKMKQF